MSRNTTENDFLGSDVGSICTFVERTPNYTLTVVIIPTVRRRNLPLIAAITNEEVPCTNF